MSILRKILLPFSSLYGAIMDIRNKSYNKGLLNSSSFPVPVICVGNLSVGGTGKTPMIEYLLRLLLPKFKIGTLSRGYGRRSKGYIVLQGNELAEMVGDEPLQFKKKFPESIVAVDEKRKRGIANLLSAYHPDVILLDDAFQHRKVKAGFNILLTGYEKLYPDDKLLPAGNLREPVGGASRAQVVIVTKCPEDLDEEERNLIREKLKIDKGQSLFFSYINYSDEVTGGENFIPLASLQKKSFSLVTGIAKPAPLVSYLEKRGLSFEHLRYPDHHNFSSKDLEEIKSKEIILTTEKDYMRLKDAILHPRLYYIPIRTVFLTDANEFDRQILNFINEK